MPVFRTSLPLLVLFALCGSQPCNALEPDSTAPSAATTREHEHDDSGRQPAAPQTRAPAAAAPRIRSTTTGVAAGAQERSPAATQRSHTIPVFRPVVTTETHWYGWQTLLSDGAALALFGAAASDGGSGVATASVGMYALGGPSVHAVHGTFGKAAARLGVRLGFPRVGAAVLSAGKDGWDAVGGIVIGGGIGILAAIALDAAWLARERVQVQEPAVTPTLLLSRNGASVGMAGVF